MTREELKRLMKKIVAAYPRFEVTQEIFNVWYECLKELSIDDAIEGAYNHFKVNQFPPTIADIKREYQAIKDRKNAYYKSISEEFKKALTSYPYQGVRRDQEEAFEIFKRYIKTYPESEWLNKARDFHYDTSKYVEDSDIKGVVVPIFKEYVAKYEQKFRKGCDRVSAG